MSDINEYKCPSCGGAIEFDSHSQKMKCPYCDTEFDLETLKKYDEQLSKEAEQKDDISDWQTDPGKQWQEGETDGMNVYTCKSCGGEIVSDENTGATSCPYCGNPVILTERFRGALRPDMVIPFKLDKKAAKEAYYKHIKGRPLFQRFSEEKIILMKLKAFMFRSGSLMQMWQRMRDTRQPRSGHGVTVIMIIQRQVIIL